MPTYDPTFFSRTFAPPSPDFDPEDYFKAQQGEDFRDVQRNVGQKAAAGLGYGTVNSMVANRLGGTIYKANAQHLLNQILAGNTTPKATFADTFATLGDKWANGTIQQTDPYKALAQITANARAAAASGDKTAVDYLDKLGSGEVQNALQYAANSLYGGPTARGFQNQMNDLQYEANRMGAGQNIGDLYASRFGLNNMPGANVTFGGQSSNNPTPTTTTAPSVPAPSTIGGASSPVTDPLGEVETTPRPPVGMPAPVYDPGTSGSPVEQQIDQEFSRSIGRAATDRERAWWKNRFQGLGGDAAALDQMLSQIANSQPAQRYRETGQAAPAVNNAADAVSFYEWLFGGNPNAPARNQWIQQYLAGLGMPAYSGTMRYPV